MNRKINQFLCYGIMIYGYIVFYMSQAFYKFSCLIINHYPESKVPSIIHDKSILQGDKKITIQNIQYSSRNSCELKDITKKGKILIKILWDDQMKNTGGFMLDEFIKYLSGCVMLYIDYKIKTRDAFIFDRKKNLFEGADQYFKKIIDANNPKRPKCNNVSMPFGEVLFSHFTDIKSD